MTREVPAIMGKASDSFTERHVKAILLTPYEANKQHNKSTTTTNTTTTSSSKSFSFSLSPFSSSSSSSSLTSTLSNNTTKNNQQRKMSMYDPKVIQELGEWLTIGTNDLDADNVARRFIDEIMAFIKSGMDYWTFVGNVTYEE